MKPANIQICSNCNKENPLYKETCTQCGHYLRRTVVNIDLWDTIWKIFENPLKAIKRIIFAEHKNFVLFLLILLAFKFYSVAIIVKYAINPLREELKNLTINALIISAVFLIAIILIVKIITVIQNSNEKLVRFKDNISVTVYSFIPWILISIILLPIEYGIFGKQWFVFNPSPVIIKRNAAYMLYGIETIMLLWSGFILFLSFKLQSSSKLKATIFTFFFFAIICGIILFIPISII